MIVIFNVERSVLYTVFLLLFVIVLFFIHFHSLWGLFFLHFFYLLYSNVCVWKDAQMRAKDLVVTLIRIMRQMYILDDSVRLRLFSTVNVCFASFCYYYFHFNVIFWSFASIYALNKYIEFKVFFSLLRFIHAFHAFNINSGLSTNLCFFFILSPAYYYDYYDYYHYFDFCIALLNTHLWF